MNKSLFFKTFRLFIAAAVLCLVCPLQKAVAQSDSGITIKMDNARLESVLDAIEQQSKYLFLNDQVDLSKTVSINVSDADIKVVLDRLFAGSDEYMVLRKVIMSLFLNKLRRVVVKSFPFWETLRPFFI